jgi:hypothetical protein
MSPRSLVLALCAAVALTGCGGGSSQSTNPSRSSAATAAATPVALTLEKAKILAAAAVLTEADLPGYTTKAQTHDASNDELDAKMATCLGVTAPTYLTRNFGTAFSQGELEVDSSADVATSPADAKKQLADMTSSKAPDCLKSQLTAALASSGLTVTSFSAQHASVTIPGSDAAFIYTMALTGTVQGRNIELRGFNAGSLVGQVEVGVSVFAPPATTFTLEQTTALLTKATERTKAAAASPVTVASPSASTPPVSRTTSAAAAGLTVIRVPKYSYTALPPELKPMTDGLDATGMVTSVVGRGITDGSGARIAAIVLMKYNPKLTALMDKRPVSQLLAGGVKGAQGFIPGKSTVTDHVLSGNQVRLIHSASASMAMVYIHGGELIEVFGPTSEGVLSFTGAYLLASANR